MRDVHEKIADLLCLVSEVFTGESGECPAGFHEKVSRVSRETLSTEEVIQLSDLTDSELEEVMFGLHDCAEHPGLNSVMDALVE